MYAALYSRALCQNPKYAGMDLVLAEDGLEIKAATIDKLIERLFLDAGMCCYLV